MNLAHFFAVAFDFARFVGLLLTPLALPARGPVDVPFGAFLARFPGVAEASGDGAFGALLARLATIA